MPHDYSTTVPFTNQPGDAFQRFTNVASHEESLDDEILTADQINAFQNITEIASQICRTPTSMINFLDDEYQWTLFNVGWKNAAIPKKDSICQFTLEQDDLQHIPDTSQDPRLLEIKAVQDDPDIGFYAGINIKNKFGNKVGTLCVIDTQPRKLTKNQRKALKTLADDIQARLELIRSKIDLEYRNKVLVQSSRFLKNSTDFKLILQPENFEIEEADPEVQGKLGYGPEEMEGTCFTDYCTNKAVAVSIKKWMGQQRTDKISIETGFLRKRENQLFVSLQISMADNRLYVTGRDISRRKKAEKQLKKEKRMMEGIIQNLPGIFCLIDVHGYIRRCNRDLETITGYSGDELMNSRIDKHIAEGDISIAFEKLGKVFEHERARNEFIIVSKNGKRTPVLVTGFRHKIDDEFFAVVIGVDITDQKQAEHKLKKSLKEREVLLAEIHHRVKNNLAIVSGMMQLQAFKEDEETVKEKLMTSTGRIQTMATIHEFLYQSSSFSKIKMDENIRKLIGNITSAYPSSAGLDTTFNLEPVLLNINQGIPFSLIVNEVVTNVLKHAYEDGESGLLSVSLSDENDKITLTLEDDGKGLPEDFDPAGNEKTLGLEIIETLAIQLDADYTYNSTASGTLFTLTFEKKEKKGAGSSFVN